MPKKIQKTFMVPESYISMGLGLLVVLVAGMLIFNYLRSFQGKGLQTKKEEEINKTKQIQPVITLPTTHKVVSGENLWTVAKKYYRSGYNWVSIASENKLSNSNLIIVGQSLRIPKVEIITPDLAGLSIETDKKIETPSYTVSAGDTLWQIAVRAYGDGYSWVKIAGANKLTNPNLIHAGNVLKLPK